MSPIATEIPPASGGGSQPGTAIVRKFPFTHATAGLATGATIYTPTGGDVLLAAWLSFTTAFDGTTPLADFGDFLTSNLGWLGLQNAPADATAIDDDGLWGPTLFAQSAQPAGGDPDDLLTAYLVGASFTGANIVRGMPGQFAVANPIKVCVSQNGKNNGTASGSTVGAGAVYLVTATPA